MIWVSSVTVSSAAERTRRSRRRVGSPAARRLVTMESVDCIPVIFAPPHLKSMATFTTKRPENSSRPNYIKISLCNYLSLNELAIGLPAEPIESSLFAGSEL